MTQVPLAGEVPQWTLADRLRKAREYAGLDQAPAGLGRGMMGRMDVEGYMVQVSWDGSTLRAHATKKMAAVALMAEHYKEDLTLTREHIASAEWKGASAMVNGAITLTTEGGRKHVLHFRKKQQDGMRQLYDALQA
jgi:hypothetical protein